MIDLQFMLRNPVIGSTYLVQGVEETYDDCGPTELSLRMLKLLLEANETDFELWEKLILSYSSMKMKSFI